MVEFPIERQIVVPGRPDLDNGLSTPPYRQVHLHSTANKKATMEGEVKYLQDNWRKNEAYYTHLVGGGGRIIQVAEVNGGGWDVGGDWNRETYAAIEFSENVKDQADFNKSYHAYIWLARKLATDNGIPLDLDTPSTAGIKTHWFASKSGHGSDHTDPLAFLESWGISYAQLKNDIKYGLPDNYAPVPTATQPASTPAPAPAPVSKSAIDSFKANGNAFTAFKTFRVDEVKKVNGILQLANYWLAGGKEGFDWTNNGIPWAVVDNTTRSNNENVRVGDMVKFDAAHNQGTIDSYDEASNGVGINFAPYGLIWFDANSLMEL